MTLALYRALSHLAAPFGPLLLRRRLREGKEDAARLAERLGYPSLERPSGPLVWLHGASVGEAQSVLALIERLRCRRPDLSVLITTGTVTSARLMAERLPGDSIHQYVPIDLPAPTARFVAHWRPDLALWIESELWPNLLAATAAGGRPMALINARMSERSFRRWRRLPRLAGELLRPFRLVLAQTPQAAERFAALGARDVAVAGNLKYAARPLEADAAELERLDRTIGRRPIWLAASIHPGEDAAVLAAHRDVAAAHPELLTVLVPRHPAKAEAMAAAAAAQGLGVARRSRGEPPGAGVQVYLADTMGELGLFYRLAPIAFVGGSLVPHGGQNLLEAARLGAVPIIGPHWGNFADVVADLRDAGAVLEIADAAALGRALGRLLDDPVEVRRIGEHAAAVSAGHDRVLEDVLDRLQPLLPELPDHARA